MSDLNQNQFCSYRLDFHVIMNASSLTGDLASQLRLHTIGQQPSASLHDSPAMH